MDDNDDDDAAAAAAAGGGDVAIDIGLDAAPPPPRIILCKAAAGDWLKGPTTPGLAMSPTPLLIPFCFGSWFFCSFS